MKQVEKLFTILCIAAAVSVGVYYILVRTRSSDTYLQPSAELTGRQQRIHQSLSQKITSAQETNGSGLEDIMKKELGYLVALKYYEQQTQAAKNFLQLQCLANSYGMRVVEPFIHISSISFPFSEMISGRIPLRFGDLIDMESWNKQTVKQYGYSSVANWEEFLESAPRDVVIVCTKYRDPPRVHVPIPGRSYRLGCKETCYRKFNASLTFLEGHQFRLVRKVCANFAGYAGSVEAEDFKNDILGNFEHDRVTVLFNEFRGFFGLYRMQVLSSCGLKHSKVNVSVTPSPRLVREVHNYALNNFKGRPYASILVRIEKLVLHSHQNVTLCAEKVLTILASLRHDRNLTDYFLAMDVGQFGSRGSRIHNLQPFGNDFFKLVYPNKWSFEDWENSFNSSSSSLNPAYIANFQRTMAARGDCLIMVGAGGFQVQARNLYDRYHEAPNRHCVFKVCSEPVSSGVT